MTDLRATMLRRLEPSEDRTAVKTRQWLWCEDIIPLADHAFDVKAGDVRSIWKVRLATWEANGTTVEGAPELLERLDVLRPQVKLEQFSFEGSQHKANVFFRKTTREYLGAVFY